MEWTDWPDSPDKASELRTIHTECLKIRHALHAQLGLLVCRDTRASVEIAETRDQRVNKERPDATEIRETRGQKANQAIQVIRDQLARKELPEKMALARARDHQDRRERPELLVWKETKACPESVAMTELLDNRAKLGLKEHKDSPEKTDLLACPEKAAAQALMQIIALAPSADRAATREATTVHLARAHRELAHRDHRDLDHRDLDHRARDQTVALRKMLPTIKLRELAQNQPAAKLHPAVLLTLAARLHLNLLEVDRPVAPETTRIHREAPEALNHLAVLKAPSQPVAILQLNRPVELVVNPDTIKQLHHDALLLTASWLTPLLSVVATCKRFQTSSIDYS